MTVNAVTSLAGYLPAGPVIELWLDGKPKGKGRPRFNGKTGTAYTPAATKLAEGAIVDAWVNAGRPRIEGPVVVDVQLWVARPQAHLRKDGTLTPKGEAMRLPDNKKPDVDNALKLIMDALNGKAYHDDVRVVMATVSRHWSMDGWERTRVKVVGA